MIEFTETHASKFRLAIGSMIILGSLVLLFMMISAFKNDDAVFAYESSYSGASEPLSSEAAYAGPNAVSNGLSKMADNTAAAFGSTGRTISSGTQAVTSTAAGTGKAVGSAVVDTGKVFGSATATVGKAIGRGTFKGIGFVASGIGNAIVFTIQLPLKAVSSAGNVLSSNSIVRPADKTTVPEIDSQLSAIYATIPEATPEQVATQSKPQIITAKSAWPIHGPITTLFGVPHRPYQDTHTGIDIISGQRSGVTPIHPFMPGTVISVVRGNVGLGNHVVIDHGNGLTSVYGHMYSIAVETGQTVDLTSIVGREGSTGASTGTHLHFEVRINGVPHDPHEYVAGQP